MSTAFSWAQTIPVVLVEEVFDEDVRGIHGERVYKWIDCAPDPFAGQ